MRALFRSLVFSALALYFTDMLIRGFSYGGVRLKTFYLVVLAIALLDLFARPILDLVSLPVKGMTFLFLHTALLLITFYVLSISMPDFEIIETTLPSLRILGFVLPSKDLTLFWSAVVSAFVVSVQIQSLKWLGKK